MIKELIIDGKRSYTDFGLMIAERHISNPKKKSIKESIPFSNVVYDFSNINGEIYWEERTLTYKFDIAELTTEEMEVIKSDVMDWFMNVQDSDIYDPYIGDYHFHGSFDSDSWEEDFGGGTITVSFTVYPYKIANTELKKSIDEIGISYDGTIEGNYSVVGLKIDGKSEQEIREGTNLFDGSKIANTNIIVSDNGQRITIPLATSGNGFVDTASTLKTLCPKLKVGDVAILLFERSSGSNNNYIYFVSMDRTWVVNTSLTITQEMLDSPVVLYGNRYIAGETEQISLLNFRINLDTVKEWEQFGASPSPDYPSEIKSVGDDRSVVIESSNGTDVNTTTIALNEPLRSLPNGICDTFENGVITRRIGKIVLDGSEEWFLSLLKTYQVFGLHYDGIKQGSQFYSSHFLDKIKVTILTNEIGIANNNAENRIYISNGSTTVEEFKTWLSSNNVTVLYELATPTIETIELPTIPTYDDVTNIIVDSGVETTFEVYYNQSKTITVYNNSSHRISPKIVCDGQFTITMNGVSYSIASGTYESTRFYLEKGSNTLSIVGYGTISFSFKGERF